jgi:hypothetical protein
VRRDRSAAPARDELAQDRGGIRGAGDYDCGIVPGRRTLGIETQSLLVSNSRRLSFVFTLSVAHYALTWKSTESTTIVFRGYLALPTQFQGHCMVRFQ